jgi:WD40 repeat protein
VEPVGNSTPTGTQETTEGLLLDTHGMLRAVAWSPDGGMLATAGNDDGSVRIWEKANLNQIALLQGHETAVISVSWSPDGKILASFDKSKKVTLWNSGAWTQISSFFVHDGTDLFNRHIQWAPDGSHLGINSMAGVQFLEFNNPNMYELFCESICLYSSFSFSPDGKEIAGLGPLSVTGYKITIWDISSKKITASLKSEEGAYRESLAWSPDGNTLAVASSLADVSAMEVTPEVWFWDMDSKTRINPMNKHSFQGIIEDMTWAPDSSQIASAGYDGTVLLWNPSTAEPWFAFGSDSIGLPSMIAICSLAWSPDGKVLAIAYQEGKVLFWDVPPIRS